MPPNRWRKRRSRTRPSVRRRTCVGCRRAAEPSALVRIARTPDGRLEIGPGPGRGAWLCAGSLDCFEQAVQRKALGRALRSEISSNEVERLREKLLRSGD